MRLRQGAVLQTLRRARAFLDAHDTLLGLADTKSREALDETIAQLTEQAMTQDRGARGSLGETQKQRTVKFALRHYHMRPIAEIAKLRLRGVPEFRALRMPDWSGGVENLLAAAAAMAEAARPHEKVLIANGLSPAFIAELQAAAKALRDSIDDRGEHRQVRSGATEGLTDSERRGRAMLKVLDGLVLIRIGPDQQLAGEWRAARRVSRSTAPSSEAAAPPPPTPTTPTPPTAPVSLIASSTPIAA